jgi:hypothetical protein
MSAPNDTQAAVLAELDATVGIASTELRDTALPHIRVTTCTMATYCLWPSGRLTEAQVDMEPATRARHFDTLGELS